MAFQKQILEFSITSSIKQHATAQEDQQLYDFKKLLGWAMLAVSLSNYLGLSFDWSGMARPILELTCGEALLLLFSH